jgi:hypothetical protein
MYFIRCLMARLGALLPPGLRPRKPAGKYSGVSVSKTPGTPAASFESLASAPTDNELPTLSEYVEASRAAAQMLERIKNLSLNPVLPSDSDAVLTRFERAERCLSGIGFTPIMPRAFMRLPRNVHDVTSMVTSGMLRRRPGGTLPIFFAGGLRRYVESSQKKTMP